MNRTLGHMALVIEMKQVKSVGVCADKQLADNEYLLPA